MAGFLFQDIVFGPVRSRRFGISLGINLLPTSLKVCSFNCIYCECGYTGGVPEPEEKRFSDRRAILNQMYIKFSALSAKGIYPDNITFAGNGEPTLHPEFPDIITDTIEIRNNIFPKAQITVLSNGTRLHDKDTREALMKVDNNVLKLDAGTEDSLQIINRPLTHASLSEIVAQLKLFQGKLVIQSLFLKGHFQGQEIDNTTPEQVESWLKLIHEIAPRKVILYGIDRATPERGLEKLPLAALNAIAAQVNDLGIITEVYS